MGSTIADGKVTEYEFDYRNRLVKVTEKNSAGGAATKIVTFQYDAFDRRTGKLLDSDANGTVDRKTAWVWDGQQVVMQLVDADGAGSAPWKLTNRYLYGEAVDLVLSDEQLPNGGIGLASVSYTTGNVLWPLFDQLGSVRDVVDSNGVIRQHLVFDSFGNRLSETDYNTSGVVIPSSDPAAVDELFGYTGREWDKDVGLQYNRARWYDPAQGRWLSQDPIGFAAGDVNWYRYVGNEAIGYTDPQGLQRNTDYIGDFINHGILDPELRRELWDLRDANGDRVWQIHHRYQYGGSDQQNAIVFQRWLKTHGGIDSIDGLGNLRAVPNWIHDVMSAEQTNFWSSVAAELKLTKHPTLAEIVSKHPDPARLFEQFSKLVKDQDERFACYSLKAGATMRDLADLKSNLGLKTEQLVTDVIARRRFAAAYANAVGDTVEKRVEYFARKTGRKYNKIGSFVGVVLIVLNYADFASAAVDPSQYEIQRYNLRNKYSSMIVKLERYGGVSANDVMDLTDMTMELMRAMGQDADWLRRVGYPCAFVVGH